MGALTLALAGGGSALAKTEPWVTPDQLDDVDGSVDLASVCDVATEILFLLSGSKYGIRTVTERPYADNNLCAWFAYDYGEGPTTQVLLSSPVYAVTSVKLDGSTLSPSEYQLYENRRLVRLPDSKGRLLAWPTTQRLDYPDTSVGTFSITYQWGHEVPAGGVLAAQVLANQIAKYIRGDRDCALSDRTVQVTRQGVTKVIMDPSQFINEARTGLYVVDTWLGAVNPFGNRRRPRVVGPDSTRKVRAT